MKKIVASLVVLFCLLLGSALAEECNILICREQYTVTETPSYLQVSETGAVSVGDASSYNVKLQMQNGRLVVTFKDANIQYTQEILVNGSSSVPLTVIGEGKNTLKSTDDGYATFVSMSAMELKGSFDTLAGADAVIYSERNICVSANIQNLGEANSHAAIYSSTGNITVSGNIGRIRSGQNGLYAVEGDIQIDGTIGQIDYQAGFSGIYCLMKGKVIINNSVGPIRAIGSASWPASAVAAPDGIELGEGISLLLPKNGEIVQSGKYYRVYDENGDISEVAQFGKPAAPATGDGMNIALWASLLTLSLIGIAVFTRKAKREY